MGVRNNLEAIQQLRSQGLSLAAIAKRYKVSGERIRQILSPIPTRRVNIIITNRRTCYVCRTALNANKNELKICKACTALYKITSGRDRNRGLVRGRDANTCQSCGIQWKGKGRRFDVHHLDGKCGKFSRSYDSVSILHQLVTVCHRCHYNLHDHAQNGKQTERHLIHI